VNRDVHFLDGNTIHLILFVLFPLFFGAFCPWCLRRNRTVFRRYFPIYGSFRFNRRSCVARPDTGHL